MSRLLPDPPRLTCAPRRLRSREDAERSHSSAAPRAFCALRAPSELFATVLLLLPLWAHGVHFFKYVRFAILLLFLAHSAPIEAHRSNFSVVEELLKIGASSGISSINDPKLAVALDASDPLREIRSEFYIPKVGDVVRTAQDASSISTTRTMLSIPIRPHI